MKTNESEHFPFLAVVELDVQHHQGTRDVFVNCFDLQYSQINPQIVRVIDESTIHVAFLAPQSGTCVVGSGPIIIRAPITSSMGFWITILLLGMVLVLVGIVNTWRLQQ